MRVLVDVGDLGSSRKNNVGLTNIATKEPTRVTVLVDGREIVIHADTTGELSLWVPSGQVIVDSQRCCPAWKIQKV